jgi:aminoglycoside phosphotransferase (APT) family kinase protein
MSVAQLDPQLLTELRRQLRDEHGFQTRDVKELPAGGNNRLFCLTSNDSQALLAKFYVRDDRPRLATEYGALSYLREHGFANVPRPVFCDEALFCAVYSFEPGEVKRADAYTRGEIEQLACFLADLHRLPRDTSKTAFGRTPVASFSLAEPIVWMTQILLAFKDFVTSPKSNDIVRKFARAVAVESVVTTLIERAISGLTPEHLAHMLPESEWRLSPGDLGPQNILVDDVGHLRFVDFEYFGWDDPARSVMDFVCHDATIGLPADLATLFVGEYTRMMRLSEAEILRFERVRSLLDIEWLTVHLRAMMPTVIARRMFANTDFDLNQHLTAQIGKFERRLALIEDRT